jgi:predicted nuclease of predicted toxin-antitoxin system
VKVLIDECLAPRVADLLNQAGHEAIHVGEVGLLGHPDTDVMAHAHALGLVVVSADTDFGELLATSGDSLPSVILLRRNHDAASRE